MATLSKKLWLEDGEMINVVDALFDRDRSEELFCSLANGTPQINWSLTNFTELRAFNSRDASEGERKTTL